MFATGLTTGTVVDSGDGITHAVPIYEGFAIPHAIQAINISGSDLTEYLHSLLMEKHSAFVKDNSAGMENAKKLKEKACIVAQDFDAELK